MSRGVADNSDPDDANLNSQSGPITPQGLPNGSVQGPSSSPDASSQGESATTTNGGNNTQHADELREQSPGPHLHEMMNGSENDVEFLEIEGMDKFIRMNGDEGGSGQSTDSAESNETFDPDLRRVKVRLISLVLFILYFVFSSGRCLWLEGNVLLLCPFQFLS